MRPLNIICFATFFKGGDFMRECKAEGCNVILVTKEKMLNEDWPREVLDEVFALPNDAPVECFSIWLPTSRRRVRPIELSRWKSLTWSLRLWRANTCA